MSMMPPETEYERQKAKKKPDTTITRKTSFSKKENTDGINYFTYDRQGGIIEEKNAAGNRRFTYNSFHQQTQVETETGKVQKNRYDAEAAL